MAALAPSVSAWFTAILHRLQELWQQGLALLNHLGLVLTTTYHQLLAVFSQASTSVSAADLWQPILYWLLVAVMLVGVVGAFVPALPGMILIVIATAIWGLVQGFGSVAWALGIAIATFLLGIAVDYLAGILGAQRVGASRWGQLGAVVGMVLGVLGLLPALPVGGPILGLFFGTVLGAFVGEFLYRGELALPQRLRQSLKVGVAIVAGNLIGNVVQGILAIIATAVFIATTWYTVFN